MGGVVNLLAGNDSEGAQVEATVDDSEEARGSGDPPPIQPGWAPAFPTEIRDFRY